MKSICAVLFSGLAAVALAVSPAHGAADWRAEWERTVEAAKKEGKVVAGIPASAELRKQLEAKLKEKFGLEVELFPARGPENVTRIVNEGKAGVRYFDLLLAGGPSPLAMVAEGLAEPFEPLMILPEVKDPRNWWGGHIWEDNVSGNRQVYAFQCYSTETVWANTDLVKLEEIRSYDDLLHPKWKGKIGYLDPRNPGSGQNTWAVLWKTKGEDFLRKLVDQDMMVTQNQRQLAEALGKGKLAVTVGLSYYTFQPFVKAGVPVKPVTTMADRGDASNGSGVVAVVKNSPHPNAAKVFVNWLLGKEGQETYGRALIQGTRRLDVDTQWMKEFGNEACKDHMSVDDYYRREVHLESSVLKVRTPAREFAKKLLK